MFTKRNAAMGLMFSALTVIAPLSHGASVDQRWYVAPSLSYIGADNDRIADDGPGFQLGLGKAINEQWNLEISAVGDTLDLQKTSGEFRQRGIVIDGLYFFNRNPSFAPYAVIGVGGLKTKIPGAANRNLMANIGVGAMHQLSDGGIKLRGDVRYRYDDDDKSVTPEEHFNDWIVNVGLLIPFGSKSAPAPAPAPKPMAPAAPKDSDGDGVIDANDTCPNSPADSKVDQRGCPLDSDNDGVINSDDRCPNSPANAKVDAAGCEIDSDGDGVVDSKDSCPNSPANAKVDASGCEVDSDGDGFVDSKDSCPHSAAGAKVDNTGCKIAAVIVLEGVNFATSSDRLTDSSSTTLDDAATTLKRYPDMVVEVAGYTDNRGALSFNQQLSQKRAAAVAAYLVAKGVDAANLSAKGYGPVNAIADNATAQGRALNRRVELHIIKR